MTDQTNGRKVHECGGQMVISMPRSWMAEHGIEEDQIYKLEARPNGFVAERMELRRVDDA